MRRGDGRRLMRILLATTQVPFVWGGAEAHAEGLRAALCAEGHAAEIIRVPFKGYPPQRIPEQMLACRLLDVTESSGARIDMLIGLKFPAYLVPHPNKVLWILHQHRMAYELWDHPLGGELMQFPAGRQVRALIHAADRQLIPQANAVFANSRTVAGRLKRDCDVDATPLYHPPPHAEKFSGASLRRVPLLPEPAESPQTPSACPARSRAHQSPCPRALCGMRRRSGVSARAAAARQRRWGRATSGMARACRRRRKAPAVCACLGDRVPTRGRGLRLRDTRSDAVLESGDYVHRLRRPAGVRAARADRDSWSIPRPQRWGAALDRVWAARDEARAWGEAGRARYDDLAISWRTVVRTLLA